jgi:hypothetical protein
MDWINRTRVTRKNTSRLLDLAEQGVISWESLARDALNWMSDSEVQEFAERNDYFGHDGLLE